MLKNYGFEVVDLGKDVAAERIVDAAQENGAAIIGLSALMTTTMVRMEDTVKLVRERGLPAKVIIGGAVVTEKFCTAIGADGWSTDAVKAVKLAQSLLA
jgi:5-methyltetrahydrofolate--homocysteine methyltransferase